MKTLLKIKSYILYACAVVSGFSVVAMMVLTCSDVFCRNVLNMTIKGAYETSQYILMPLCVFLAMPAAYDAGIMPRVGDLIDKAPAKLRAFIDWTVLIVELIIYFLLAYGGVKFFLNGVKTHSGVTMGGKIVETYPIYIIVPICFIAVFGLIAIKTFLHITKKDKGLEQEKGTENDNN